LQIHSLSHSKIDPLQKRSRFHLPQWLWRNCFHSQYRYSGVPSFEYANVTKSELLPFHEDPLTNKLPSAPTAIALGTWLPPVGSE
jgi:hypothetical protein